MSTVETLRDARDLYASAPSHATPLTNPKPGTVCVVMALSCAGVGAYGKSMDAIARAAGLDYRNSVVRWNAENDTETVLAAFDTAIANEEAREQEHNVPQPVGPAELVTA